MALDTKDPRLTQYASTVDGFFKGGGHILAATEDNTFLYVLRNTLGRELQICSNCISVAPEAEMLLKVVNRASRRHKNVLLFLERRLQDREMGVDVKQIKNAFSQVKIIVLTNDAEQQKVILLHEVGADNFIIKPISVNTLIEKMAFTIKPQNKLGELIEQGKEFAASGSFENALKISRNILELKPNSAAGLLIMGDAFKGLGKRERAEEAYIKASEEAPMYMEPLKKLALFYRESENPEGELIYLERLDKLSPLNVVRKVDMGGIHLALGKEDKAERLFDQAMEQAHREAMARIEEVCAKIGQMYEKKDPAKAESYYRKALGARVGRWDKSDLKIFTRLGIALRKQGKWNEAVLEYDKALTVCPDDEHLHYNIAMAHAEGKQYDKAAEAMEKALELDPDLHTTETVVSYNIGMVFLRNDEKRKAKYYLELALKLDPAFHKAATQLHNLQD